MTRWRSVNKRDYKPRDKILKEIKMKTYRTASIFSTGKNCITTRHVHVL